MSKYKKGDKPTYIHKDLEENLSLSTFKRWFKKIKFQGSITFSKVGRPALLSRLLIYHHLNVNMQTFIYGQQNQRKLKKLKESSQKQQTSQTTTHSIIKIWAIDRGEANQVSCVTQRKKFPYNYWFGLRFLVKNYHSQLLLMKELLIAMLKLKEFFMLLGYGNLMFEDTWTFQQEDATYLTSNSSQNWCILNLNDFLPKEIRSQNSPDVNPLEYSVRNQIVLEMKQNQINSKATLIKQIKAVKNRIQNEYFLNICRKWYLRIKNL
ncbi:hypothetical protein ABPG72_019811 [Tetrahymena utriculariae]